MSVEERLEAVLARVEAACSAAGRARSDVRLVAVSKMRTAQEIQAAMACGQLDFGENYAQHLRDKCDAIGEGPVWHFIGALQKNKVKYVAGRAHLFHALDRIELADEFQKRSDTPQPVLVAVNTGGEASKSGVDVDEALALCEAVELHPGVALRGLMTIPPPVAEAQDAAPFFATLAGLAEEGRRQGLPLTELSMGMSHDFEVAIAQGATLVRVGTAIFGPRPV
ncbi:MAG: YggS family pyridoxal phosphate-dependent enzyme [Myxococcota bacterium]|nr:YggS family pyridoxal phosphate-dependent enzyme [Myxococcota bacterium]